MSHLSASQKKTFLDCKRLWGLQKIDGLETPPTKGAWVGSLVHEEALEPYLLHGKLPDPDTVYGTWEGTDYTGSMLYNIIRPGLKHIPKPGACEVESWLDLIIDGVEIKGRIDFRYQDTNGVWIVGDHKTSSDIYKYGLKPESMLNDIQVLIYAMETMVTKNVEQVRVKWVYYSNNPKKPATRVAERLVLQADIAERLPKLRTLVKEMTEARQAKSGMELEPNFEACGRYGGCPFRNKCNRSFGDKLKGHFKMANMSVFDQMKAYEAEKEVAAEAPAEVVQPKKEAPPKKTVAEDKPVPQPDMPASTKSGIPKGTKRQKKKGAGSKVNPPAPKVEKETRTASGAEGFILCIDCNPVKGASKVQMFGEIVEPVLTALKKEHGTHYRLVPNTFGGAPALLSEALDAHLTKNPVEGAVHMSLASTEARDALEVMVKHAGLVVKG